MSGPVHPAWARDGRDWPNRAASRFHRVGAVAWHVQRMGTGARILLLHGTGGATHSWRDLMPALAAGAEVIAPDLPGHGFTRAPAGGASSLPAMARAVAALLEAEDAAPDLIVGHSAGAAVALQLVLTGAVRPRAVVGLNAALTPFAGAAGALFPATAKALALNPFVPLAFAQLAGWSAQARRIVEGTGSRIDAEGLRHYGRLLGRTDHVSGALGMMAAWDLAPLAARLDEIDVPIHLLVGSGDRAVPPAEAEALAARHPAIGVRRIEGLGHLMHEERPDEIAGFIAEILAEG